MQVERTRPNHTSVQQLKTNNEVEKRIAKVARIFISTGQLANMSSVEKSLFDKKFKELIDLVKILIDDSESESNITHLITAITLLDKDDYKEIVYQAKSLKRPIANGFDLGNLVSHLSAIKNPELRKEIVTLINSLNAPVISASSIIELLNALAKVNNPGELKECIDLINLLKITEKWDCHLVKILTQLVNIDKKEKRQEIAKLANSFKTPKMDNWHVLVIVKGLAEIKDSTRRRVYIRVIQSLKLPDLTTAAMPAIGMIHQAFQNIEDPAEIDEITNQVISLKKPEMDLFVLQRIMKFLAKIKDRHKRQEIVELANSLRTPKMSADDIKFILKTLAKFKDPIERREIVELANSLRTPKMSADDIKFILKTLAKFKDPIERREIVELANSLRTPKMSADDIKFILKTLAKFKDPIERREITPFLNQIITLEEDNKNTIKVLFEKFRAIEGKKKRNNITELTNSLQTSSLTHWSIADILKLSIFVQDQNIDEEILQHALSISFSLFWRKGIQNHFPDS